MEEYADKLEAVGIARDSYAFVPLDRLGAFIAKRITAARQAAPDFPVSAHINLEALTRARAQWGQQNPEVRISINDVLVKAAAMALMTVPRVNASFIADGIAYHNQADVAIAVATDRGLITPIVRGADRLSILDIATASRELIGRARAGKLKPDEYTGGTFSLSNLGMFGVSSFGSIINPPHAAILSIGSAETWPVWRDDHFHPSSRMTVTLTCDHRVIDGATAAAWLSSFREMLESADALWRNPAEA
jgi:pyruvate dehydrogenase E2 component (dihydrolipoamide acetyltransferase)